MKSPAWITVSLALGLLLLAGCGEDKGLKLDFSGANHVSKSALMVAARRELSEFRQHPSEAALADAGYAMEQALTQQGFAHGHVSFNLLAPVGTVPHAAFSIDEGPRVYLKQLRFPGAIHFSQEKLRGALQGEGIGIFDLFKAPFRLQDLDRACESVESLYLLDGFYRVVIARPAVTFSADGRWAIADIPITENRYYAISAVAYDFDLSGSGMARRDFAKVLAQTDLIGQPYYARLPSFTQSRIRTWLANRGHLDASVTSTVTVDDQSGKVLVTFTIVAGPVYILRQLHITGNVRTLQGFIRKNVGVTPQAPISQDDLDEAMLTLTRSGAFTSVRWRPEESSATGVVRPTDVEIAVAEAKSRTVDFEIGYGSYEELRGGVRYQDRNLFGAGRYLEIHPTASLKGYGADGRLRDNFLLGRTNTLELNTTYLYRRLPTYNLYLIQATLSIEHRFSHRLSMRGGYTYESEKATDNAAPVLGVDGSSYIPAPRIFDGLRYDDRDSPVEPTRGTLASVALAYSSRAVGSELDFIEYNGAVAQFFPLTSRLVLGLDARYDTRELRNSAETLPVQERLFLGGENSVRSYREMQLSPTDGNGALIGGLTAAMATVELRMQLAGDFWLGGFYDIGEVNTFTWRLDGTVGQAIGTGLRYQLPVGPIRFDLAYNPKRTALSTHGYMGQVAVGFSF